jgi:hypothetical protein
VTLVRAAGGEITELLAFTICFYRNTPISEDRGEGYHRYTHLTLLRAAASRMPWILGSTRHTQNLGRCLAWVDEGELARKVFNYEWQNWKRILRPSNSKRWVNVKLTDSTFFKRLYCLEKDTDDWGRL